MNARALLNDRDHRPWPLPASPWVMTQTWSELLFAHWPLAPETLRSFLPPQLALDTWEGDAWIGVVPFRMTNVRPRFTPPVPWLSAFPELNVRTYVTAGGKPGVWFFSLDAANPVAVAVARTLFALPYFRARMACRRAGEETVQYRCARTHRDAPAAELEASYRPVGPTFMPAAGTLEQWLTERYCLYAVNRRGMLSRGEIHHRRWRLRPGEAELRVNTMALAAGVTLPEMEPLLHVAEPQETLIWAPRRVGEGKL